MKMLRRLSRERPWHKCRRAERLLSHGFGMVVGMSFMVVGWLLGLAAEETPLPDETADGAPIPAAGPVPPAPAPTAASGPSTPSIAGEDALPDGTGGYSAALPCPSALAGPDTLPDGPVGCPTLPSAAYVTAQLIFLCGLGLVMGYAWQVLLVVTAALAIDDPLFSRWLDDGDAVA